MLTAHLQDAGAAKPAESLASRGKDKWKTETAVTPLKGTRQQVYWSLAYGAGVNPAVLEMLRQGLAGLAK
jgi:hypothetical protein